MWFQKSQILKLKLKLNLIEIRRRPYRTSLPSTMKENQRIRMFHKPIDRPQFFHVYLALHDFFACALAVVDTLTAYVEI